MATETRSIFPCQPSAPVDTLVDLARWAFTHMVPGLDTSALVDSSHAEEHECFEEVRRSYGRLNRGFEVVDRTEYYEGGGWLGSRRWTDVYSYGLPEEVSLRIALHHEGSSATVEVTAPGVLAAKVATELERRLSVPPSEKLLDALTQNLSAHLHRHEWALALAIGHGLLRFRPADPKVLLAVGTASGATGDLEMAELALVELVERVPSDVDGRYNLGNLRFESADWNAAAEQYRAALAIDPHNHPAAFQLGRALENSGHRDDALAAYRLADSTSPKPTGAWGYRGLDFTDQARAAIQRLAGP